MDEHSRYNVGKEEEYKILKNKLGIYDQKMLDDTETLLLSDTYEILSWPVTRSRKRPKIPS